jgi:ribosomal protein S18 acetylase RimI-like enzyme
MVLAGADAELPSNPRVTLEHIDRRDLLRWVEIQHRSFGGSGEPSEMILKLARTSAAQTGSILYLARLAGAPVGAGVLMEWAGVLGIYGVATSAEVRSQGVGTAMVRRMIRDARARGDMPLCLQAETGGKAQHWYERLGFQVVYDRTGWTQSKLKG